MPVSVVAVVVSVALAGGAASAQSPGFSDVPPGHPFYDEISWAASHGITTGYADGTFRPTQTVTRQAAVAFLHRLWAAQGGVDTDPPPDPGFSDVPPGHPFYDDIAWAADLGITTGYADGTFGPTRTVTRQAMVAFLYRLGHTYGLWLVVDTPVDAADLSPGDGTCDIGDGTCSLRAAIDETNASAGLDVITIAADINPELQIPGVDDDTNATGDLDITDDLALNGNGGSVGAPSLDVVETEETSPCWKFVCYIITETHSIDGMVSILGGVAVSVSDLTIRDLEARDAAVDLVAGTLSLDRVVFDEVYADEAGVRMAGDVDVVGSVLENSVGVPYCSQGNLAFPGLCGDFDARGWGAAGVEVLAGDLTVIDSSIAGHVAGLSVDAGSFVIDRTTVTADRSVLEADLYYPGLTMYALAQSGGVGTVRSSTVEAAVGVDQVGGSLALTASTVAGSDGPAVDGAVDVAAAGSFVGSCVNPISSGGYNLDGDRSCFGSDPTDKAGYQPLLAPLADNGGVGAARLPATNSPLVDEIPAGTAGLCDGTSPVDQRGQARPGGAACDIGAVEGTGPVSDLPLSLVVDTEADGRDIDPGDGTCRTAAGACSLRAAVDETNALPAAKTVTFAAGVEDVVLSVPGAGDDANVSGDLDITGDVTIDGGGLVTIDAAGLDRVVHVQGGILTLDGLTVTGGVLGDPGAVGGGVEIEAGAATIVDSAVSGNRLDGDNATGAGVHLSSGTLLVDRSTVSANRSTAATGDGGGIYVFDGAATVVNSTVSGNEGTRGAGLYRYGGTLDLSLSTVADNAGDESVIATAGLTLTGTVVDADGRACWGSFGSGGYNVVSDATCGLTGVGDAEGVDPRLGPLAGLAVNTLVHLLDLASPAADLIPTATAGLCDGSVDIDQIGAARPGTIAGCSAGAVEEIVPITLDLLVDDSGDAADAAPGDGACLTAAGLCTLRAAVDETNSWPTPDRITIGPGVDPVLSVSGVGDDANVSGDIDVTDEVTIVGQGATLDAAGLDRAFDLVGSAPVTIDGLTVTGGAAVEVGAGIRQQGGYLTLVDSEIRDNVASSATAGARGGGLAVLGDGATITGSTFADNRAASTPVAPFGGGIYAAAPVSVAASTLDANQAVGTFFSSGGAIHAVAPVMVTAATITGNSAAVGAGIRVVDSTVTFAATILDNGTKNCLATGIIGKVVSDGGNLDADGSCPQLDQPTDLIGSDPALGSLGDNGGFTRTRMPLAGSPVIEWLAPAEAACASGPATDQLGQPRPRGVRCDIGAVEGDPTGSLARSFVVDDAADGGDIAPGDGTCLAGTGTCTLRAAIDEANATPFVDTITIASGVNPTLSLAGADEDANATGDLDIAAQLVIEGGGATIDGAGLDRVLDQLASAPTVVVRDLTISGGYVVGSGGAIRSVGSLAIADTTLTGNTSIGNGGAIVAGSGALTVDRSAVVDNTAGYRGGGIHTSSPAAIVNATMDGNTAGDNGGNLYATSATEIRASTITGGWAEGQGSGIYATGSSIVVLGGTLLANSGEECRFTNNFDSLGYNISSDDTCGLDGPGDLQGFGALTGPLGSNGGSTPSRLLHLNSPALDAIPFGVAGLCDGTIATDQRGQPRPAGAACDIGSTEGDTGQTGSVGPATFVVDTPVDRRDADPNDGICDDGTGSCSLRAALDSANFRPGPDTIAISPGVDPVLSLAGSDEDGNASGDLDIIDEVTIVGGGAAVGAAGIDRVFHRIWYIGIAPSPVLMTDLTITGGVVNGVDTMIGGAAIYDQVGGLTLDGVTLVANRVTSSGPAGLAVGGAIYTRADLTMTNSEIIDNSVDAAAGTARGGGIYVDGGLATVTTLTSTTFDQNLAVGAVIAEGGGLYAQNGVVSVADTTFSANTASSPLTAVGGAIRQNNGQLHIERSVIDGNLAEATSAGFVRVARGGGVSFRVAEFTASDSTFSANRALAQVTASGGAIHQQLVGSLPATIDASTFVANEAAANSAAEGGALYLFDASVSRSTLVDNTAGDGASLFVDPAATTVSVAATTLATSSLANCGGLAATSAGYNVVDDGTCGFSAVGDQEGIDPQLGPLTDNGGPTPTALPRIGSPLIDAIALGVAGLCDGTEPVDQRGQARPIGAGCDTGATERQPTDL